jgi:D-serine deaminase-like pyridoxal phosphate-dependent protein
MSPSGFSDDLDTPYLLVDLDVLRRNVDTIAAMVDGRGTALRPHAKTHKCLEIARLQLDAGAVGLTVATVGEAEIFADAGFTDLFIAYPVWAGSQRGRRLRALAERATLRIGIDSVEGAEALAGSLAGVAAEVVVEIDSGHHRSGVQPGAAGKLAVTAARAGLDVVGVFTFPGHSYGPGRAEPACENEFEAISEASASLYKVGISPRVRSGGSTPTIRLTESAAVLTETRPGVYVFNDAQQLELGTCEWSDLALSAATTVVSRHDSTIIVDAGSKVLGADQQRWATGGGRLPDYPDARVGAMSEHHATIAWPADVAIPELGAVLRVVPNHVCTTVNLADELVVISNGSIVDRWRVAARGANT